MFQRLKAWFVSVCTNEVYYLRAQVVAQDEQIKRLIVTNQSLTRDNRRLGKELEIQTSKTPEKVVEHRLTMTQKQYEELQRSFPPPIVGQGCSGEEAAYKLGVQAVLMKVGERYVTA